MRPVENVSPRNEYECIQLLHRVSYLHDGSPVVNFRGITETAHSIALFPLVTPKADRMEAAHGEEHVLLLLLRLASVLWKVLSLLLSLPVGKGGGGAEGAGEGWVGGKEGSRHR